MVPALSAGGELCLTWCESLFLTGFQPMGEPDHSSDDSFAARLKRARDRRTDATRSRKSLRIERSGPLGIAWRLSVEIVVALAVLAGIGWLLDSWLGTGPLFLVVFFFLGAGVGMWNAYRAARDLNPMDEVKKNDGDNGR